MSGGSFNYLCHKEMNELMMFKEELSRMEHTLRAYGYADIAEDVRMLMEYVKQKDAVEKAEKEILDAFSSVFHAVEWYESGDSGRNTMIKVLEEYSAKRKSKSDIESKIELLKTVQNGLFNENINKYKEELERYRELGTVEKIQADQCALDTYRCADSDGRLLYFNKDGRCEELGNLTSDDIGDLAEIVGLSNDETGRTEKDVKIKAASAEIIFKDSKFGRYYAIKYYDLDDKMWNSGFGSFDKSIVEKWLEENFIIDKSYRNDIENAKNALSDFKKSWCNKCGRRTECVFEKEGEMCAVNKFLG